MQSIVDVFTFLGEKFLGVFARQNELSGNFPQQLDDQGYVICDTHTAVRSLRTWQMNLTFLSTSGSGILLNVSTYLHLWSNHPPSEVQTDNLQ